MNLKTYILGILILVLINGVISVWYASDRPEHISLIQVAFVTNTLRILIVLICVRILFGPRLQ